MHSYIEYIIIFLIVRFDKENYGFPKPVKVTTIFVPEDIDILFYWKEILIIKGSHKPTYVCINFVQFYEPYKSIQIVERYSYTGTIKLIATQRCFEYCNMHSYICKGFIALKLFDYFQIVNQMMNSLQEQ